MQTETTVRLHLLHVRIAILTKKEDINLGQMWRKRDPRALLLGMQIFATAMENSMEVSEKLNTRTTI